MVDVLISIREWFAIEANYFQVMKFQSDGTGMLICVADLTSRIEMPFRFVDLEGSHLQFQFVKPVVWEWVEAQIPKGNQLVVKVEYELLNTRESTPDRTIVYRLRFKTAPFPSGIPESPTLLEFFPTHKKLKL